MKYFLDNKRVMCLTPHPDDVEYSMSGTILKFKDTIFDIYVLSYGGDLDLSTNESRYKELVSFWAGVENVNLMYVKGLEPYRFKQDIGVHILERDYDFKQYDAICIPCREDNHFFHTEVSNLGRSLCRVSQYNLYEYFTPSAETNWIPNLVVEINVVYDEKKKRLLEFKSQSKHIYFSNFCLHAFHSDLHYNKKGFGWIEKFKILDQHL